MEEGIVKEDFADRIAQLRDARDRLREALAEPADPHGFIRDSAIKRFEMCIELAWKTLQQFLLIEEKVECASPRKCLQAAFKAEVIPDDPFLLEMLDMRNLAAHTYKEALAQELYAKLPDALKRFDMLLERMSVSE
ncbi:MAG TPA: HI0074 family nucleotidyltransferase substrate-binding subunit [Candidatus Paceibacterota bacterium]|nr:HI0074 family nucleotidyltransferase substrate-binding subunit [Candidatus Paceibacterota bacterium]